ncbi:MAG: hypothetical protein A2096_00665 [Spirochaetes bacterium GWF1_41_5]|nr:MAG: hypothetical protein A2096_00665 [Spirochaetes bacterium GWF1_41_5]
MKILKKIITVFILLFNYFGFSETEDTGSFSFSGEDAMHGWSVTKGAAVKCTEDFLEIQASDWDSKIFRSLELAAGKYNLSATGSGKLQVKIISDTWKALFKLDLHGDDFKTGSLDFDFTGGKIYLAIQVDGNAAQARIKQVSISAAADMEKNKPAAVENAAPKDTTTKQFPSLAPSPAIVRGFMSCGAAGLTNSNYFSDAKKFGANVIRLQVFPAKRAKLLNLDFSTALPGFLDELVTNVLLAKKADIKVVIDLHDTVYTDISKDEQWKTADFENRLCSFWSETAKKLLPYKDTIWGYDLLNEPLNRSELPQAPKDWRMIAINVMKAIRKIDSETWIIFEPGPGGRWMIYEDIPGTRSSEMQELVPLPDPRIIYSCHFYHPKEFTHQGVAEIKNTDLLEAMSKINVKYPSKINNVEWNKDRLEVSLKPVIDFQKKWKVPVYIGEFSVIRWAPKEDAVLWIKNVIDIFEKYNWSWSFHAFREFHGWSIEHDEKFWIKSMPAPEPVAYETERAKVIKQAFLKNWK